MADEITDRPKVVQFTEDGDGYTVLLSDGTMWNGWYRAEDERWLWTAVRLPDVCYEPTE